MISKKQYLGTYQETCPTPMESRQRMMTSLNHNLSTPLQTTEVLTTEVLLQVWRISDVTKVIGSDLI